MTEEMKPKPKLRDIVRSPWFKIGLLLHVTVGMGIAFFIVDAKCLNAHFFITLSFSRGIDGAGDLWWIWLALGVLLVAGFGCYAVASWIIDKSSKCMG